MYWCVMEYLYIIMMIMPLMRNWYFSLYELALKQAPGNTEASSWLKRQEFRRTCFHHFLLFRIIFLWTSIAVMFSFFHLWNIRSLVGTDVLWNKVHILLMKSEKNNLAKKLEEFQQNYLQTEDEKCPLSTIILW